jgi:hypothetical protein
MTLAGLWLSACQSKFAFDPPKTLPDAEVPEVDAPLQPPADDARDGGALDEPAADSTVTPPPSDTRSPDGRADTVMPDMGTDGAQGPVLCGSDPRCSCGGTQCNCALGQSCTFTGIGCEPATGSCTLLCHNQNSCTGTCNHGCNLQCYTGSTCSLIMGDNATVTADGVGAIATVTVGAASSVKCEHSATCFVTCTGSCELECEEAARCYLTCGSATAIQANAGGSCL